MTKEELTNLKEGTTIVIERGVINDVVIYHNYFIQKRHGSQEYGYVTIGTIISLDKVRIATKEDIDCYILDKQNKLDQLERKLKSGLK